MNEEVEREMIQCAMLEAERMIEQGGTDGVIDVANLILGLKHIRLKVAGLKEELMRLHDNKISGVMLLASTVFSYLDSIEVCVRMPGVLRQQDRDESIPPSVKDSPEVGVLNLPDAREPLSPCPFCGGPAEWEYTPWDEAAKTGDDGSGWVECQLCHVQVSGYCREDGERRWNTRLYALYANQQQQKEGGAA